MSGSRTEYVKKNIFYGYLSTIISSVFSIAVRTVFVYTLGASYLGVSGLFTNVLGVLSFAELGIGSAIVFSLYKPIADNDNEKIKSLLALYKKAYRIIAIIVSIIGLCIIPFLNILVNSDIPMSQIRIFYLIFLFNTVSYKTSYVSAIQKEYIITNTTVIGTILTNIVQVVALLLGGDYLSYLIIAAVIGLLQKIATVIYLNKKFPILTERDIIPLDTDTKRSIWKNVKALIIHKIGEVSVNQTDNIIVSAFVSTTAVGLLSNYTTLNGMINRFTGAFFGSFTASFGNMLAKEKIEKQRLIFDVYDLLGFWIYGFVFIAFVTLSQPFISLLWGENMLVDNATMILYFTSMFFAGMTYIPYSYKVAAGLFNEDKWVAFAQAIINLIVSIIAVKVIGLPGIFVGTLISRMIVVIFRPYVVYKYILKKNVFEYYLRLFKRTILLFLICTIMWKIEIVILNEINVLNFIIMGLLVLIVPNIIFFCIYRNTNEFNEIVSRTKLGRIINVKK